MPFFCFGLPMLLLNVTRALGLFAISVQGAGSPREDNLVRGLLGMFKIGQPGRASLVFQWARTGMAASAWSSCARFQLALDSGPAVPCGHEPDRERARLVRAGLSPCRSPRFRVQLGPQTGIRRWPSETQTSLPDPGPAQQPQRRSCSSGHSESFLRTPHDRCLRVAAIPVPTS